MANPYNFNQDNTRSPLDRPPPNLFPAGQPPSFKTNVNRMKTKKWVEAKQTAYDGGDWGDYDEYDEYGTEQQPPLPPIQTGFRQQGQAAAGPGRSFTDPQQQGGPPRPTGRRNSFEAGEEQAFYTPVHPPARHGGFSETSSRVASPAVQTGHGLPQSHTAPGEPFPVTMRPGHRQPSGAESDTSETFQHRRDFSPSAVPPPLQTRMSPAPGSATGSPVARFPARKSSLSQTESPASITAPSNPVSQRERAPSNPAKPLPFIRPADIYRRLEEERQKERASMDSQRPSLDSLSRPGEDTTSPKPLKDPGNTESLGRGGEATRSLHPMETVAERKSEYLPDFNVASQDPVAQQPQAQPQNQGPERPKSKSPELPSLPVLGISTFDNDFWSSGTPLDDVPKNDSGLSPPSDHGFRSVVDHAFARADDEKSIPPTPISKQSESGVSRSNTDSTSGISPIMSRVPSSATSALKNREGQTSTPVINEETSETSTPMPSPGAQFQIQRKPSPNHSRNVSTTSLPSPARSPAFADQKSLPEPEAALPGSATETSLQVMEGGLQGPSPSYAEREADIAVALKKSPEKSVSELGAAEKESQIAFLETHASPPPQLSGQGSAPQSRSASPTKGRVQELAGKFGEVSHSRRGSVQSVASTSSVQSWERSQENSRPSSPQKPDPKRPVTPAKETTNERPSTERELSFRPKLPGQWESYATTAPSISEQSEKDVQLRNEPEQEPTPQPLRDASPLNEVDLRPTTSKHPVTVPEASEPLPSDPLAAVKAAGAAIGDAIKESIGLDVPDRDTPQSSSGYSIGDVYVAPLQTDKAASSVGSSVPPTPPAKDTPEEPEYLPPPPPFKENSVDSPLSSSSQQQTPTRPTILPQLSTEPSIHDRESDRLRKEIVASLSPTGPPEHAQPGSPVGSLQPYHPSNANRESSILPAEYDSYWADDGSSPRQSQDMGHNVTENRPLSVALTPAQPATTQAAPSTTTQPHLLTRFSWEDTPEIYVPNELGTHAQAGAERPTGHQEEQKSVLPQDNKELKQESLDATPTAADPPHAPTPIVPESVASLSKEEPKRALSPVSHEGLHVVNTELNPEAVDMPPRISYDAEHASEQNAAIAREAETSANLPETLQANKVITSAPTAAPQGSTKSPTGKSPTSDRPLNFGEITALKSSAERIATYNKTREIYANTDHGLNEWISSTLAANPSLTGQPLLPPQVAAAATPRHKATGSLSLFGKHHSTGSPQSQGAQSPDQYSSANQAQAMPQLLATTSQGQSYPPSATVGVGRSTSHQMQLKGKDLLHTAGMLGGKGMTSAKGLFAKGKSRFRASGSDKVVSSREASEEPELITTPEKGVPASIELDASPKAEKKTRRLSSAFRRSSRSRSRPSSIALPKNQYLDFPTMSMSSNTAEPQDTPPREGSRPHSFHAPDSWNVLPDHMQQPSDQFTPPKGGLRPPERLGVLPSPAKSAFSLVQPGGETDVPPVPRIPNGLDDAETKYEDGQRQNEAAQAQRVEQILQSVVRYSTPPSLEASRIEDSAVWTRETPEDEQTNKFEDSAVYTGEIPEPETLHPERNKKLHEPADRFEDSAISTGETAELDTLPRNAEADAPVEPVDNFEEPAASKTETSELHTLESSSNAQVDAELVHPEQDNGEASLLEDTGHGPENGVENEMDPETGTEEDEPHLLLNHETVERTEKIQHLIESPETSPPAAPNGSDTGDVSPVGFHPQVNGTNGPSLRLDVEFLQQPKEVPKHDVSPMLRPTRLTTTDGRNDERSPTGQDNSQQTLHRPAYETEQIGAGDVSPISSHGPDEEQSANLPRPGNNALPVVVMPDNDNDNNNVDNDAARAVQAVPLSPLHHHHAASAVPNTSGGMQPPAPPSPTPPPPPPSQNLTVAAVAHPPGRLFHSSYQVVHAVQYVPSHSSMESWEQESIVAPSQSEGSQMGDRPESDTLPPVPPIPSHIQERDQGERQQPEQEHAQWQHPPRQAGLAEHRTELPQAHLAAAPKSSQGETQSLLSAISSAVSAHGDSLSPTSDKSGNSRPSSANRLPQALTSKPAAIRTPPAQDRPLSEGKTAISPTQDDGFDLYADHNGIVKDVQDKRTGQPLRVTTSVSRPHEQPISNSNLVPENFQQQEESAPRYSYERPMSFISGPPDANGMPQDQINAETGTPGLAKGNIVPGAQLPGSAQGESATRLVDAKLDVHQHPQGPPLPNEGRPLQRPQETYTVKEDIPPIHSGQSSRHHTSPAQSNASPPPQRTPPLTLAHRPLIAESPEPPKTNINPAPVKFDETKIPGQTTRMHSFGHHSEHPMQDPRARGMFQGQPYPQDPRAIAKTPGQQISPDPRVQGPYAPFPPPRNEYEAQQMVMRQQAMDPRLRGPGYQLPGTGPSRPAPSPSKPEERTSSLTKFSVFKAFGPRTANKTSPAPSSTAGSDRSHPNPVAVAVENPTRNFPPQSNVGHPPTEQLAGKKREKQSSLLNAQANRPQSIGADSYLSHDSTRVQPADSRLDLRYPASPLPSKGIPPHQLDALKPANVHRSSTSAVPDPGKKRRFSGLQSLFSRSGTAGSSAPKTKLTKEEKKAQKAQKNGVMSKPQPGLQPPGAQQWPPRQFTGQPQPNGAYGQPRPPPGTQPAQPQYYGEPPRPMAPAGQPKPFPGMPPPQVQQQQQPPAFQSPRALAHAQRMQVAAQQQVVSPPPPAQQNSHPAVPPPMHTLDQITPQTNGGGTAPPMGGYYAPSEKSDVKRWSHEPGTAGFAAIERQKQLAMQHQQQQQQAAAAAQRHHDQQRAAAMEQHQQQQHHHQRNVSSPISPQSSTVISPISQRRVSAPIGEPRYEAPPIPAAYNPVNGPYTPQQELVYQSAQSGNIPPGQPLPNVQLTRPSMEQQRSRSGHQYPDPNVHTVSPPISDPSPSHPRTYSNSSSIVSPVSEPSPGMSPTQPAVPPKSQKPRMSSITEAAAHERPWNVNLPAGATEQEIVRARHQQYMEQLHHQQIAQQQQLREARSRQTPSPHSFAHPPTQTPSPHPLQNALQQRQQPPNALQGFREVLPRSSPQPYPISQPPPALSPIHSVPSHESTPQPEQPAPIHPTDSIQPAAFPLPMSPQSARSPVNPLAAALPPPPPPKVPHSPRHVMQQQNQPYPSPPDMESQHQQQFPLQQHQPAAVQPAQPAVPYHSPSPDYPTPPPQNRQQSPIQRYPPTHPQIPESQHNAPPTEEPPPYTGPGLPDDGTAKPTPSQLPNLSTVPHPDLENSRGRSPLPRSRQPSLGLLQHPQPASMAASPQRSPADMGADILRLRLLEQEEQERVERIQKAEVQRAESAREREERERARARARELERSVSGGARVESLRNVGRSGSASGGGWAGHDRRGSRTGSGMVVYELPAEEDDEPVMRGVSYPGMEWTPAWEGDI